MPFLYFCAKKINQPKSYIMKTKNTLLSAVLVAAISPLHCHAQELPDSALQERTSQLEILPYPSEGTESPRGVYKLTYMRDKHGNLIQGPFDQYKICTDSVTLMLNVQGNQFFLNKNDSQIFNYTGEEPDANDTTATRIFDSNAAHFTQKWWSTYSSHIYFPKNDWCTEYYESGKYSDNAKQILDALMSPNVSHPKNPFIGTWRLIGMMDELRNVKKELKKLREDAAKGMNIGNLIFTPTRVIMYGNNSRSSSIEHLAYAGKWKKIMIGDGQRLHEHAITWLSKDCIAMEVHIDGFRTDYQIWERVTDSTPLFNKIASQYVIH